MAINFTPIIAPDGKVLVGEDCISEKFVLPEGKTDLFDLSEVGANEVLSLCRNTLSHFLHINEYELSKRLGVSVTDLISFISTKDPEFWEKWKGDYARYLFSQYQKLTRGSKEDVQSPRFKALENQIGSYDASIFNPDEKPVAYVLELLDIKQMTNAEAGRRANEEFLEDAPLDGVPVHELPESFGVVPDLEKEVIEKEAQKAAKKASEKGR